MTALRTIPWPGYLDGAITKDANPDAALSRRGDGNLYITNVATGEMYNVHPRATAAGWGDDYVEHPAGVYPVRWKLDKYEIERLD